MSEEDDVRLGFLVFAEIAVMISVKQVQDDPVSVSAVAVFKNLHARIPGQVPLLALRQLHWALVLIVMAHESTDEAHQDVGRRGSGKTSDAAVFSGKTWSS